MAKVVKEGDLWDFLSSENVASYKAYKRRPPNSKQRCFLKCGKSDKGEELNNICTC